MSKSPFLAKFGALPLVSAELDQEHFAEEEIYNVQPENKPMHSRGNYLVGYVTDIGNYAIQCLMQSNAKSIHTEMGFALLSCK